MKVLTEANLRNAMPQGRTQVEVGGDVFVTASARRYAAEHNIDLVVRDDVKVMSRTPVDLSVEEPYLDAVTGQRYAEKPENMTHIRANVLVPKSHPRIAFRGQIDLLQSEVIALQAECGVMKRSRLVEELEELLQVLRAILAADVKDEPLPALRLWGKDSATLRYESHHVEESVGLRHPQPEHRHGVVFAKLNRLRALIRVAELAAVAAFGEERGDIQETLNRLSSAVYLLAVKEVKAHGR